MKIIQNARLSHHTIIGSASSGLTFSIPSQEDFTDGSWSKTDLALSEIGVNEYDGRIYIRVGNSIKELQTGGGSGSGPQGPIGPQGVKGSTGSNGTNGTNGTNGATGPQGSVGPQGSSGGGSGSSSLLSTTTIGNYTGLTNSIVVGDAIFPNNTNQFVVGNASNGYSLQSQMYAYTEAGTTGYFKLGDNNYLDLSNGASTSFVFGIRVFITSINIFNKQGSYITSTCAYKSSGGTLTRIGSSLFTEVYADVTMTNALGLTWSNPSSSFLTVQVQNKIAKDIKSTMRVEYEVIYI